MHTYIHTHIHTQCTHESCTCTAHIAHALFVGTQHAGMRTARTQHARRQTARTQACTLHTRMRTARMKHAHCTHIARTPACAMRVQAHTQCTHACALHTCTRTAGIHAHALTHRARPMRTHSHNTHTNTRCTHSQRVLVSDALVWGTKAHIHNELRRHHSQVHNIGMTLKVHC